MLPHSDRLPLKRWNIPIYTGWKQITKPNSCANGFNLLETSDFLPLPDGRIRGDGRGRTQHSCPSQKNPGAWSEYRRAIANTHRAPGCVGTITDGAIRDLEELTNAECKAIARWLCVGQAAVPPARWNCEETPPPQIQFPRSQ